LSKTNLIIYYHHS